MPATSTASASRSSFARAEIGSRPAAACRALLLGALLLSALDRGASAAGPVLAVDSPSVPPHWALLERELLREAALACREFHRRYFDERGYLRCVERWGGDDGPDDAIENLTGWPLLHALGGPDEILPLIRASWEGHLRQYSEARTAQVPMAREGMYFREFPVCMDWLHNGEGLTVFNLLGLSDPNHAEDLRRVRRFAGFYLGDDPAAPNYDPRARVIKSLFNGSRGPLLRPAAPLDWAGDPIEVEGRFHPLHGERNYAEMLEHFAEYHDVVGDHPLNLLATTLALNAFLLTGEARYRAWLLEYVDAWAERMQENGSILPSNVGLDGKIGSACGGKWYGGVYGWGFTVKTPRTGELVHRNQVAQGLTGFTNAYLLTGERRYLDAWGAMLEKMNSLAREVGGKREVPTMHGENGWYAWQPAPWSAGALDLYLLTLDPVFRRWAGGSAWLDFLEGKDPEYPVRALQADLARVRDRVAAMRRDPTTPDTRLSDDPLAYNPAAVEAMVSLALGGLPPSRCGGPLHCRLRYFDPLRRRAGLPEETAALVERLERDRAVVTLVNLSPVESRLLLVQGGAYAEHEILSAEAGGKRIEVKGPDFTVRLEAGTVARIELAMRLHARTPTLKFPWDR